MTKSKSTKLKKSPLIRKRNNLLERIRYDSETKKKKKSVKWSKSITQEEVSIPNTMQPQQATILPPIPKGSPLPKPLVAVNISIDDINQYSILQASKKNTKRVNWSKSITQKDVSIPNNVQPQQATIITPILKGSPLTKPLVAVKMSIDDIEKYSIVKPVK